MTDKQRDDAVILLLHGQFILNSYIINSSNGPLVDGAAQLQGRLVGLLAQIPDAFGTE